MFFHALFFHTQDYSIKKHYLKQVVLNHFPVIADGERTQAETAVNDPVSGAHAALTERCRST